MTIQERLLKIVKCFSFLIGVNLVSGCSISVAPVSGLPTNSSSNTASNPSPSPTMSPASLCPTHQVLTASGACADIMWVQMGAANNILVRAIAPAGGQNPNFVCPPLTLNGATSLPMNVRTASAQANATQFPITVCEASIPIDSNFPSSVSFNGQSLPIPKVDPSNPSAIQINSVVAFGETGCRVNGTDVQACNDVSQWPFSPLASGAASLGPDLVVHLGDYVSRQTPCQNSSLCGGSPYGDSWDSWKADFFSPAYKLLQVAPWVFIRGSQETCSMNGHGWLLFLDPRDGDDTCNGSLITDNYYVSTNRATFAVLDSADAGGASYDWQNPPPALAANLAQVTQLSTALTVSSNSHHLSPLGMSTSRAVASVKTRSTKTKKLARKPSSTSNSGIWILTHVPVWAKDVTTSSTPPSILAAYPQWGEAFASLPSHVGLVLSAHIHSLQTIGFADGAPSQMITGAGGTELASPVQYTNASGATITLGATQIMADPAPILGRTVTSQDYSVIQGAFGFMEFLFPQPLNANSTFNVVLFGTNKQVLQTKTMNTSGSFADSCQSTGNGSTSSTGSGSTSSSGTTASGSTSTAGSGSTSPTNAGNTLANGNHTASDCKNQGGTVTQVPGSTQSGCQFGQNTACPNGWTQIGAIYSNPKSCPTTQYNGYNIHTPSTDTCVPNCDGNCTIQDGPYHGQTVNSLWQNPTYSGYFSGAGTPSNASITCITSVSCQYTGGSVIWGFGPLLCGGGLFSSCNYQYCDCAAGRCGCAISNANIQTTTVSSNFTNLCE